MIEPGHSAKEQLAISPEGRSVWGSKVLNPFLDSLERFERPIILDLGSTSSDNISFFGTRGWKVYAYDFLREYRETSGEAPFQEEEVEEFEFDAWRRVVDGLDFALDSLHGVLFWDILDKLPQAWAREVLRRVSAVLEQDGLILSFFGGEKLREDRTFAKFRILDGDRIEHLSGATSHPVQRFYQNSEILSLFSGFSVLNFYSMKDGYREILVQKPTGASAPA